MIAAVLASFALSVGHSDCPLPKTAPWINLPAGCATVAPGVTLKLPRGVTEVDIWSTGGATHLRQRVDQIGSTVDCLRYSFKHSDGYLAEWSTCNRRVIAYGGRALRVFYWTS